MTITRVKPDFALGDKLTSTEMDAIDTNATYALDKRAGETDTLASTITQTGTINLDTTGKVRANASGAIVEASASGAKIAATASGATIEANTAGAKIVTLTGGRIELGDDDYPTLASGHTGRTVIRRGPMASFVSATDQGVSYSGATLQGYGIDVGINANGLVFNIVNTGSSTISRFALFDLTPCLIDGATLTEVSVIVQGAPSHAGLPARMPRVRVSRVTHLSEIELHSSGTSVLDTSANTAAYQASHSIVATCDQNNVVDKALYRYFLVVWNEGGTNGLIELSVGDVTVTQTITDLRPA